MSIICEAELREHLYGTTFPADEVYKHMKTSDDPVLSKSADEIKWLMWALKRLLYDDFYEDHPNKFKDDPSHRKRRAKGIVFADEIVWD